MIPFTRLGVGVLGFGALVAFAGCTQIAQRTASNLSTDSFKAYVRFFSKCDSPDPPAVEPFAWVCAPWSEKITIALEFWAWRVEHTPKERGKWTWASTTVVTEKASSSSDLIRQGFVSFDGSTLTENQSIPSLVRSRTPIGEARSIRIGKTTFTRCQYFLNKTDFGTRRSIVCPDIGTIAEDELYDHQWHPSQRFVAIAEIGWRYPHYSYVTKRPPFYRELEDRISSTANSENFYVCGTDFNDILDGNP